jgi:hypothetical protein
MDGAIRLFSVYLLFFQMAGVKVSEIRPAVHLFCARLPKVATTTEQTPQPAANLIAAGQLQY